MKSVPQIEIQIECVKVKRGSRKLAKSWKSWQCEKCGAFAIYKGKNPPKHPKSECGMMIHTLSALKVKKEIKKEIVKKCTCDFLPSGGMEPNDKCPLHGWKKKNIRKII
jgi:hypothetical protein